MRALTIGVNESAGRMLCCSIFRPGGRKILGKGHLLNAEDVRMLATEGMSEVWVTELEDGEVGEDEAVFAVANAMCCGSAQIKLAAGGRANVLATEPCCALVDEDLLKEINRTSGVVIATSSNFRYASKDDRMATVKSAPFAVSRGHLEAILKLLADRGQILQARPIRDAKVNVLYTDPVQGERARLMFEGAVKARLDGLRAQLGYSIASVEEEEQVVRALHHLLRTRPATVLVASSTTPAGPEDVIGRALVRVGAKLERFLAPVDPGTLLLLGYQGDTPILSAPCCFRSLKPNVVDLLLPPMLARYRVSAWEVGGLGHGGLLS
jgi:molybdenum cofactor cytidylyltransferase